MFVYHWHYALHNGAFTESTTVGVGWYILVLTAVVVTAVIQFSGRK